MFQAGSNLLAKSPEEIFYQDFKKFVLGDVTLGVGQITSMTAKELAIAAFALPADTEKIVLEHVVSRKKQVIPALLIALQE